MIIICVIHCVLCIVCCALHTTYYVLCIVSFGVYGAGLVRDLLVEILKSQIYSHFTSVNILKSQPTTKFTMLNDRRADV